MPTENWEHKIRTSYRRQLIAAKAIIDGYARLRQTLTYGTLVNMIGPPQIYPAVRNEMLDLISSDANAEGRSLITVIVTNSDGEVGDGWFALAESVGRDISDRDALLRNERDYVFAHANDEAKSSIF